MKIVLCDTNPKMIEEWKKNTFNINLNGNEILITDSNIFKTGTEAIVSPANSYGIMRGGFDGVLSRELYKNNHTKLEQMAQSEIFKYYNDKILPVGNTLAVELDNTVFKYLIIAPTMKNPGSGIKDTQIIYNITKSILETAVANNIQSVTITGLGTGVGGVSHSHCAKNMALAIFDFIT